MKITLRPAPDKYETPEQQQQRQLSEMEKALDRINPNARRLYRTDP